MLSTARRPRPLFVVFFFLVIGLLIYSNSFRASFRFDDYNFIADKMQVRDLGRIWSEGDQLRKIPYLTFALNYRWTGLDVWSWHLVNTLLHVLVSFLVYAISRLIWRSETLQRHPLQAHAEELSIAAGLVFLCHPLATSAVTYIYQRIMVLAALFHALTLWSYLRARILKSPVWFAAAAVFALLACFTKQVNLTLPLTLALSEMAFCARSSMRYAWRKS